MVEFVPARWKRWTVALAAFSLLCTFSLIGANKWLKGVNLPLYIQVYLILVVTTSAISFVLYGTDKLLAIRDKRRIPERVLNFFAWCGGWPGAIFGQETFRHKTQKASFRLRFWIIVCVHLAVIVFSLYLWWNGGEK